MCPPSLRWFKRKGGAPLTETASRSGPAGEPDSVAERIEAGIAAEARGDAAAAEHIFRNAVEAYPLAALARMNYGIALQAKGDIAGAAVEHARAVRLDPTVAHAHYNLALAHLGLDQIPEAEHAFREALRLQPEFPEALVGLADTLESAGRDQEAIAALDAAIELRPQYVGAMFNAGLLLRRMGRLDDAETRLRGVPLDHPEYANAMTALAATLRDQGRIDEAADALRSAVDRVSNSPSAQSELLLTMGFSERISAKDLFAEHVRAGGRAEARTKPWCANFPNSNEPDRILNVGYMSGDFRGHSVAVFTEFLFERHRRDLVRVHAYSSTPTQDAVTARFIATADVWRDLHGQTDAVVAKAILDDRIDVLVDLSGHTGHTRVGVLAGRAAPVQMTWLGYMNTTGLTRVDYRITDAVADPHGMTENLHTERLLRMPHSQWCFRPPQAARDVPIAREGSPRAFTFGSFNQFAKVSDATIGLWVSVLTALPAARLRVVGVPRGRATDALARRLSQAHIDRPRYDLVERVPLVEYYAQYGLVDACIDTTPYSGGTTTCDAFWMGVPVIGLTGARSMSRSSASLLAALGYGDHVTGSKEEFVVIASRIAAKGEWPTPERVSLHKRFVASPLMDEPGFTRDLEALYRQAWREWCAR